MIAHRVAAIDCGTNTIRLLISSSDGSSRVDLVREMRVVRLGQDVDRTGRLSVAAIERTRVALVDYAALIDAHDVAATRMIATSATRDAANSDDFSEMVVSTLGFKPEVISGEVEAQLSFAGAAAGFGALPTPLLVADIGGGSTEVILGDASLPRPAASSELTAYSMNIGCVRLTERWLVDDPPSAAQLAAAQRDIDAALELASAHVPIAQAATFVGVAGTVTTMAAIVAGLQRYDPAAIHGFSMTSAQIVELTDQLARMTLTRRAALPVMHPGRADVIVAGALVLSALVRASGAAAVIASEHDILDGIAASISK